ncbi:hypothetical protein [Algoriphagus jejuensis]
MKNLPALFAFAAAFAFFSCQEENPNLILADQLEHPFRAEVFDKCD